MAKEIPLTQGKVAIVDDEDFDRLSQFKWSAWRTGSTWRAVRRLESGVSSKGNRMSKFQIMYHDIVGKAREGMVVDHINHNALDNRRENLRFAERGQNNMNRRGTNPFGVKGVYKHKRGKSFFVQVKARGVLHRRGGLKTLEEAIKVSHELAKELHGEFACREVFKN
jgi:hypothetical protein